MFFPNSDLFARQLLGVREQLDYPFMPRTAAPNACAAFTVSIIAVDKTTCVPGIWRPGAPSHR